MRDWLNQSLIICVTILFLMHEWHNMAAIAILCVILLDGLIFFVSNANLTFYSPVRFDQVVSTISLYY